MMLQIVWVIFLTHHCLPKKKPKMVKKMSKVHFRVNYYLLTYDDMGAINFKTK